MGIVILGIVHCSTLLIMARDGGGSGVVGVSKSLEVDCMIVVFNFY